MTYWQRLSSVLQVRFYASTEQTVRRVAQSFGLPAMLSERGVWNIAAARRNTYRVSLHLWAMEHSISFMAASQLLIERDWLPRELLLLLLEENHRIPEGSFRLTPQGTRRYVVLGRVVNAHTFPETQMKALGESLIARMQQMITTLYARELIIAGPEPADTK